MAEQRRRRSAGDGGQIPQRVENAAQSMQSQYTGPWRGYVPPAGGQTAPPQGQSAPAGQQGYGSPYQQPYQQTYYAQQSQMTGSHRGFVPAASPQPPEKTPKKSSRLPLIIALVLVVAALGTGGYFAVSHRIQEQQISDKVDPYAQLFCPGVYVNDISLAGMTPQQAWNSVTSQLQQAQDNWSVRLVYEDKYLEIDADDLEFSVDPTDALQKAWEQGHTGDREERYDAMLRLETEPYRAYTTRPEGNTGKIDEILVSVKALIDKPAVDAQMVAFDPNSDGDPFTYTDEEYGLSLDIEPIKEKLYQMASAMENGTLNLEPERIYPTVYRADLQKQYMLRSYKTTPISSRSPENRNSNIRTAFDYVNTYGSVLAPGDTFSFNKVVGERTEARGFLPAIEYVYGEEEEGIGGGVCQASTNLYQAAICAGLEIRERYFHSDAVSYSDYGKDATVYWGSNRKRDLKFRNNTDGNIYIVAKVKTDPDNKKRLITAVSIYGLDMEDVRYDLVTEDEVVPPPSGTETVKDTSGKYVTYKDETMTIDAKEGHVIRRWLVKYVGPFEESRTELSTDKIEGRKEKVYVGVKSR